MEHNEVESRHKSIFFSELGSVSYLLKRNCRYNKEQRGENGRRCQLDGLGLKARQQVPEGLKAQVGVGKNT